MKSEDAIDPDYHIVVPANPGWHIVSLRKNQLRYFPIIAWVISREGDRSLPVGQAGMGYTAFVVKDPNGNHYDDHGEPIDHDEPDELVALLKRN